MKHLKKIRLNIARYILLCSVICRNCSQLLFFNLCVRDVVVNSLFGNHFLVVLLCSHVSYLSSGSMKEQSLKLCWTGSRTRKHLRKLQ